ncbi:MAG: N-acetylmuramoyl-L-alanine amidase [Clostridia bacterium]|nr:N-acetylmuramoyl-L-alanine amidase [Clostridia bacterium]
MATVFLSPSTQDYNLYVTGNGSEAQFMNRLADAMIPGLLLNGVSLSRSAPDGTVADAVAQSNAYNPDLHVALHSNAAPEGMDGQIRGPEVYYYKDSESGRRAAELIAAQLAQVYPYSDDAALIPTDQELAELVRTEAPAVFVEVGYHDNLQDAAWIESNLQEIANAINRGIADFLDIPFSDTDGAEVGRVTLSSGTLNLRSAPSVKAPVIGSLQNGEIVVILRTVPDWMQVLTDSGSGYAASRYITIL